jgi:hypothetical protein
MKKLLVAIFALILVSCSTTKLVPTPAEKSELKLITQNFEADFKKYYPKKTHREIRIGFANIDDCKEDTCVIGRAWDYPFIPALDHIEISISFWRYATKTQKKLVVYHEIGHYLFDIEHDDVVDEKGCPRTIMSSGMPEVHYCMWFIDTAFKRFFTFDVKNALKNN